MRNRLLTAAASIIALGTAATLPAQVAPPAPAPAEAARTVAPAPAPAQPQAEARAASPAMWVVKDEDTTIYMFGTVHVLKPGLSWFDGAVRKAFDSSDEVVLEIVLPENEAEMAQKMLPLAMNPAGPPLTQRLPEAVRPRYAQIMQSMGTPANALDAFHPWFASLALMQMKLPRLGYSGDSGADKQISAAAKAAGKPIIGLETIEQQMGFLSAPSPETQMAMLVKGIEEFDQMGSTLDTMVEKWAAGDPDALAEEMNDQLNDFPEVEKVLLTDRNARWADWIRTRLEKPGTVFMAVGAGHLAGRGSVQEQLTARGMTARRVDYR